MRSKIILSLLLLPLLAVGGARADAFDLADDELLETRQQCLARCYRYVDGALDICSDNYRSCNAKAREKIRLGGFRSRALAACEAEKDKCIEEAIDRQNRCIAGCPNNPV